MDVEITKVKREEKEASRREILELRRDLERTYELKSEALMNREKNAIERLQKHQEVQSVIRLMSSRHTKYKAAVKPSVLSVWTKFRLRKKRFMLKDKLC